MPNNAAIRWAALAAIAAAVLPGTLDSAAHAYVPDGASFFAATIREPDGTTLEADVFRPSGLSPGDRTPVILQVSPYMGTTQDQSAPAGYHRPKFLGWDLLAGDIFKRGYTYVEVALRGYGGSTGCSDLGGPGQQLDVKTAVEWTASQPWSTGRVGMWGMSYEAWAQVMALATKPRGLAAVVMQSPVVDPLKAIAMNGVRYLDLFGYAGPEYYNATSAEPPGPYAVADPVDTDYAIAGTHANQFCAVDNATGSASVDPRGQWWRARNLLPRAIGSRVPTLITFGFLDEQVHATQFLGLWRSLRGPRELFLGQWRHELADPKQWPPEAGVPPTSVGRDAFFAQAMRWLDRYVKQTPTNISADPVVTVEDGTGHWRAESDWPSDVTTVPLRLRPGSYNDLPGNDAENTGDAPLPGDPTATPTERTGVGVWTVGEPTPGGWLSGVPRLSAHVSIVAPGAHLVALLYDVSPNGSAVLVSRGARQLDHSGTVAMELWPQDWRFAPGHRVAVLLTSSDDSTFTPGVSAQLVRISGGELSLPCLISPGASLSGSPSLAGTEHAPIHLDPQTLARSEAWSGCPTPKGATS